MNNKYKSETLRDVMRYELYSYVERCSRPVIQWFQGIVAKNVVSLGV